MGKTLSWLPLGVVSVVIVAIATSTYGIALPGQYSCCQYYWEYTHCMGCIKITEGGPHVCVWFPHTDHYICIDSGESYKYCYMNEDGLCQSGTFSYWDPDENGKCDDQCAGDPVGQGTFDLKEPKTCVLGSSDYCWE